jgi:predicted DNA-binding transcriptional regulator YafY
MLSRVLRDCDKTGHSPPAELRIRIDVGKRRRKKTKRRKSTEESRYSPATRLTAVRNLLNSATGIRVDDIAERLEVSRRTAHRYLSALEKAGEKIYDEMDGHQKVWRLLPSARSDLLRLTTSQMMSLYFSRRVFSFLEGTGFLEDLEEVFRALAVMLKRKDFVAAQNLDRKLFDVNEAPYQYRGRLDDVNGIVTALVRDDRIEVRHTSVEDGKKKFVLDPYTLVVYKKGLYLFGYSHHHKSRLTFGLDGFVQIDWMKGNAFEYPEDYDPTKEFRGAFGLIKGPKMSVRIFFDESVRRFVERRKWHPNQKLERCEGGILFSARIEGVRELESWVLGFGDKAEVLGPESLRTSIAEQLGRAQARYAAPPKKRVTRSEK